MEHRPRATFPWRIQWIGHPETPAEQRSEPERVVNRAYLALDCITRVQRIGGSYYWTHTAQDGLSEPLSEVYHHVAMPWSKHPGTLTEIDRWVHENVPEGCAFREMIARIHPLADLSWFYRWRLARKQDFVAFKFVHS